jgi:hypothetical protein
MTEAKDLHTVFITLIYVLSLNWQEVPFLKKKLKDPNLYQNLISSKTTYQKCVELTHSAISHLFFLEVRNSSQPPHKEHNHNYGGI